MVAVDDRWRGKGIATALLDRTRSVQHSSWSVPMTMVTPPNIT
jgi:GNAT superfamily N-acetyltransferase